MATGPMRPCQAPGCGKARPGRERFCTEHQGQATGWFRTTTKSRQARGYGGDWDKLRLRVLRRDRYQCQLCLVEGIYTPATEVDHRVPKSQGGTDDEDNLQGICRRCHGAKTRREGQAGRVPGPPGGGRFSRG